jgi:hypothetical protein
MHHGDRLVHHRPGDPDRSALGLLALHDAT